MAVERVDEPEIGEMDDEFYASPDGKKMLAELAEDDPEFVPEHLRNKPADTDDDAAKNTADDDDDDAADTDTDDDATRAETDDDDAGEVDDTSETDDETDDSEDTEEEGWDVPLTVAGEAKKRRILRKALDDPESPEGRELIAALQKSEDYDRKGGALDQAADRKGSEIAGDHLVKLGVMVRGPEGNLHYSPHYQAFYAAQHNGQAQQAQTQTPPPDYAARLAAVRQKVLDDPSSENVASAFEGQATILQEQIRAERHAEAQQAQAAADNRTQLEQTRDTITTTINDALDAQKDRFVHPVTGAVDKAMQESARARAFTAIAQHRDLKAGVAAIQQVASEMDERYALVRDLVAKLNAQKKRGAKRKKAAPVLGGGTSKTGAAGGTKEPKFNPNKPFEGYQEWAEKNLSAEEIAQS